MTPGEDLKVVETSDCFDSMTSSEEKTSAENAAGNCFGSTALPLDITWSRKWDEKNVAELQQKKAQEETSNKSAKKKVECIMQMLRDSETQNAKTLSQIQTTNIFQSAEAKSARISTADQTPSVAETVLGKFRKKIDELKQEISCKEEVVAKLKQEIELQNEKHRVELEKSIELERSRFEQQQRVHDMDLEKRLKFIDSLLQDKEKWVKQCESLSQDIKNQQEAHESQIKALKDRMAVELRKQKSEWTLKENEKREKWMKAQKEEILHTTAKAMEPKFAEMSENHKDDMKRLKEKLDTQRKALSQQEEHAVELRQRLLQEREDCLEKERLKFHAHLIGEKDKLRLQRESEMDRMKVQWKEEKEALINEIENVKLQAESKIHRMQDAQSRALQRLEDKYQNEKEKIFADHKALIQTTRQNNEIAKEEWKKITLDELQEKMGSDLQRAKTVLEKERDEEIEVVIGRFESEKEDLESDLRRRIVQLQHEHEAQLKVISSKEEEVGKLSTELSRTKERCSVELTMEQEKLEAKTGELAELKRKVESLQALVEDANNRSKGCEQNHQEELKTVRDEFLHQLRNEESLRTAALCELDKMQEEKEDLKKQFQSELDALNAHVKKTLENKDAFIGSLQRTLTSKVEEHESMKQLLIDHTHTLDKAD